jgi:hypothetical protein
MRKRALKLFAVAVSQQAAADLCMVPVRVIREATELGLIPVNAIGNRKRILVCDLVSFVRSHVIPPKMKRTP